MELFCLFRYYYIDYLQKRISSVLNLLKIAVLPTFFVVAVLVIRYLLQAKLETSSGSIRTDDFIVGLKAWLLHPIFGNGYLNYDTIRQLWQCGEVVIRI